MFSPCIGLPDTFKYKFFFDFFVCIYAVMCALPLLSNAPVVFPVVCRIGPSNCIPHIHFHAPCRRSSRCTYPAEGRGLPLLCPLGNGSGSWSGTSIYRWGAELSTCNTPYPLQAPPSGVTSSRWTAGPYTRKRISLMMKMPQLQVFEYFPPARRGIEADGVNCRQEGKGVSRRWS